LNVSVNPNGSSTTLYYDYGLTSSYGNTVTYGNIGSGSTSLSQPMGIDNLQCNTTYHFRAHATNSGGTTNGSDRTFTTDACTQSPPSVTTNAADNITETSARLNVSVNPNGSSTILYYDYGLTSSYGNTVTYGNIGSGSTSLSQPMGIDNLQCNTTYHFRAHATNSGGTTNGSDRTFTTSACGPQIVAPTNLETKATSNNSIALTWLDNSDNEEAFILEWRIGMSGLFNHRANLPPNSTSWIDDGYGDGLAAGLVYCYRVRSWASALGDSSYSNEKCSTTLLTCSPSVTATLVSDTSRYWAITMDSTNVYWTDVLIGAIYQIPKNGGTITTLACDVTGSAKVIAVLNSYVYWAESGGGIGSIKMVPVGGGTVTTIDSDETWDVGNGVRGLAVDVSGIYWSVAGNNLESDGFVMALTGVPVDNPSLLAATASVVLDNGLKNPTGLSIDDNNVYWIESDCCGTGGAVKKINKDSHTTIDLASNLGELAGIAVDETHVYFGEWNGNIYKVPINGGTTTNLGGVASSLIAIDNTYVYSAYVYGDKVYKTAINGSGSYTVDSGLVSPYGIAVDGKGIYWTQCPTCTPASGAIKVFIHSKKTLPWIILLL
jgi:hypothetical protein